MKFNVFDFEGTGGVALAMYNTDKVKTFNTCRFCVRVNIYENKIRHSDVIKIECSLLEWRCIGVFTYHLVHCYIRYLDSQGCNFVAESGGRFANLKQNFVYCTAFCLLSS